MIDNLVSLRNGSLGMENRNSMDSVNRVVDVGASMVDDVAALSICRL